MEHHHTVAMKYDNIEIMSSQEGGCGMASRFPDLNPLLTWLAHMERKTGKESK